MIKRKKYKVYPPLLSNNGNNTDNVWLSGPLELNDNDDVLIVDPQEGDQLIYNEVTNQWENQQPSVTSIDVKTWLTESHQIGEDFVTAPYYYYGGATEGFLGYANWDTPNWSEFLTDVNLFDWNIGKGALRPIPYDNVTKIYFNGQISVPNGNHYTNIYIYLHPCLSNVTQSPVIPTPICLGTFSTAVNQTSGGTFIRSECMNFEIDLIETLGYALGTGDMIMVVTQVVNAPSPTLARSILLSSPMLINFNLSLETTDPSLEFNTAGVCGQSTTIVIPGE